MTENRLKYYFILTHYIAEECGILAMRSKQLLYGKATTERVVSGICPAASSQIQKRLDGFPDLKSKIIIYQQPKLQNCPVLSDLKSVCMMISE